MTDVKLPPLPERLLEFDGPFWGLMDKWMAAEPGGEAQTYADAIDASIVETMQAYARTAVLQERERCAMVCEFLTPPLRYPPVGKNYWSVGTLHCADTIRKGE